MSVKLDQSVINTIIKSDKCNDEENQNSNEEVKVITHSFDEALDLTGHGAYNVVLLIASLFSNLGLTLDIFALSTVSSVAACDLHLDKRDENIMLAIPIVGSFITSYPWGYVSDIYGRRRCLLVAMWSSFTVSCLAALSPHWTVLALMKFISTCCSACTLSAIYTLLGESCGTKVKSVYFCILTSIIHFGLPYQMGLHYYMLTVDFSFDLGFMTILPWRLMVIVLALPLGASGLCLLFVYESPKWLANAGREDEAVKILAKIWKWNRKPGIYPVQKLILKEKYNTERPPGVSLLKSFWIQTVPIFRMPLLWRTLQLYFLIIVIYGACGGLYSWFPFLADAYISGIKSNQNTTEGLCNMINQHRTVNNTELKTESCVPKSDPAVVWMSLIVTVVLVSINCSMAFLASRRKFLMITSFLISSLGALGCAVLPSNIGSIVTYFGIFISLLSLGTVMSYFVDIYPTSYRGMVSSLSVMAARLSNLVVMNIVGALFIDHCHITFSLISAFLFSGLVVSCFLPSDTPKNSK